MPDELVVSKLMSLKQTLQLPLPQLSLPLAMTTTPVVEVLVVADLPALVRPTIAVLAVLPVVVEISVAAVPMGALVAPNSAG